MIYGASHLLRMMLENKVLNQRVTEHMTHGMANMQHHFGIFKITS